MKTYRSVVVMALAALATAALAGIATGSAAAGATRCGGGDSLAAGTYDALTIPAGETCHINVTGVVITGNLKVEDGAGLAIGEFRTRNTSVFVGGNVIVQSGASFELFGDTEESNTPNSMAIDGNLIADHARRVLNSSPGLHVSGNVLLDGVEQVSMTRAFVAKNIHVGGATATAFVKSNHVAGSIEFLNNALPAGAVGPPVVGGNTVGKNLICFGNSPPPINQGLPNVVSGVEAGQCASL
jgi:hypothetical protein